MKNVAPVEPVQIFFEYLPLILNGAVVTIQVAVLSLVLSVFIGMLGALAKLSKNPFLSFPVTVYTTVIRGIPDLILILLLYYGGQIWLNELIDFVGRDEYIQIEPYTAGIVTIGFIFGGYMCETFRGAMLAIKPGQIDAARAFGMNAKQVFFRITFPLMVRNALPGFFNNWQVLLKSTALISIIGLEDMMRMARIAGDNTRMPFTFLFASAVVYLLISTVSIWGVRYLEKKYPIEKAA